MRAGKLDCTIEIRRTTPGGGPSYDPLPSTVETIATLRAQLIEPKTEAFLQTGTLAEADKTTIVFRTRYFSPVYTSDTIAFDGGDYIIKEIVELGRRRGLEIRTLHYGARIV